MAHTITGKLNKAATTFQAGDSVGFGLRIGVQYYDRETKQKEWTNYEAVIFAKPGAQADFYASSLVEGSIVEVSGPTLKIKRFEGQNGLSLSIEIVEAKVGYIGTAGTGQHKQQAQQGYSQQPAQNTYAPQQQHGYAPAPQQRPAPQPQQQQYQQTPQQQYQNGLPAGDNWDDDIPFNQGGR
jgi:single-stranded DNA-binding protein